MNTSNFDIFGEEETDDDFKTANSFDFKKVKQETFEQKQERLELSRIIQIRRILTGNFSVGAVVEDQLYSLINNEAHCKNNRLIQDTCIDKYGNTALHYALAPDCAGELKVENLAALACSFVLETVLSCHINPHVININGLSALNFISEIDVLDTLEKITKEFRPDVYCPIHFSAIRKKIKGK